MLGTINQLVARYCGVASFVFVYIEEAHASDEWPVGNMADSRPQHTCLADRVAAANDFTRKHEMHPAMNRLVDSMGEHSLQRPHGGYASWPTRFWVVADGEVALKAMPTDSKFDIHDLRRWLERRFPRVAAEGRGPAAAEEALAYE